MKTLAKLAFIVAVTALAWFNVAAAILAVAATILVVIFDKAKDVVEISFGLLKAKIQRDISEAERLVGQLRDFSALQTKAILSAAVRSGRWGDESDWLFHHVKALEASLAEMGAPADQVAAARQEFVNFTIADAGSSAMGGGHVAEKAGVLLEKEWRAALGRFPDRDPNAIEVFLDTHGLMSPERRQLLDDMHWMKAHGDVRDAEMYLRAQTPIPWK